MERSSRVVATRALNALRRGNLPGYIALRCLLQDTCADQNSDVVMALSERALLASRRVSLHRSRLFKSFDGQQLSFRTVFLPSPSFALAEAALLREFTNQNCWIQRGGVYSYRRSDLASDHTFQFFGTGYRERNERIKIALAQSGGAVVVSDVKGFYPSIDAQAAIGMIERDFEKYSIPEDLRGRALHMFQLVVDDNGGLKIGPALSHYLADRFLAPVDELLSKEFPARYFRYVDDVAVVVPPGHEESAYETVKAAFATVGLELNATKRALGNLADWSDRVPVLTGSADPFNQLKWAIKFFAATRPGEIQALDDDLRAYGIFLPVQALGASSQDERWWSRLQQLLESGWHLPFQHWYAGKSAVLRSAVVARQYYNAEVSKLKGHAVPANAIRRKWLVSRVRYLVNRAIYLNDSDGIRTLLDAVPNIPELYETAVVLDSIASHDVSRSLSMPGPTALTVAEQFSLRGIDAIVNAELADSALEVDAIAPFILRGIHGVCGRENASQERTLGLACEGKWPSSLVETPSAWLEEVGALLRGLTVEDRIRLVSRRALKGELSQFEALQLGHTYYEE